MTPREAHLLLHLDTLRLGTGLAQHVRHALAMLQKQVLAAVHDAELAQAHRQASAALVGLLPAMAALLATAYTALQDFMQVHSLRLAQRQAQRLLAIFSEDAPVAASLFDDSGLAAAVADTPFPSATRGSQPSATAAEWWTRQEAHVMQGLGDQLRAGVLAGEAARQLEQRVTGTRAQQYADGVLPRAVRSAAAVAQAQAVMAATQGTEAVAQTTRRGRLVLVHVSTLDDRTTALCRERDGKQWHADTHQPVGHALSYQKPPLHFGCRSYLDLLPAQAPQTPSPTLPDLLAALGRTEQRRLLGDKAWRQWQAGTLQGRDLVQAIIQRPLSLDEESIRL